MPPYLTSKLLAVAAAISSMAAADYAQAGTALGFPKDAPAFTFELPDEMQADYQADGKLVCTSKDGGTLKGVVLSLPNISNYQGALMGLNRLIRLTSPRFLTGNVQYPASFNEDTPSGIHPITVSAFGTHDGKEAGLALIVFS